MIPIPEKNSYKNKITLILALINSNRIKRLVAISDHIVLPSIVEKKKSQTIFSVGTMAGGNSFRSPR